MPHHNNLSESEEMYLVTLRKICESCEDTPIPIPDLAEALHVQPVSANQMIKKLTESGFVKYTPYKGVELTTEGRNISTKILRHRRLWEVFLVKDLKIALDDADALACRLEHLTSEDVAQRLSVFLGDPIVCFHGSPIYTGDGSKPQGEILLSEIKAGQRCQITRVATDENTRSYLATEGLSMGLQLKVNAISSSGSMLIEDSTGNQVALAKNIVEKIFVEEISE